MRILFAVFFAALATVLALGSGSVLWIALHSVVGPELATLGSVLVVMYIANRFWPRHA